MKQTEQTPVAVGVNYDADYKLHQEQDLVSAINTRMGNFDNGTSGSWQNIEGTTLSSNASVLPSGSHICVGVYENNNKDRLYYFLKNSLGNHGVYYYDWFTRKHTRLISNANFTSGNVFTFDERHMITEVGEIGDYLVFSDYNGFAKYVDTTVSYTSGTSNLEDYQVSVVPIKPTRRPLVDGVVGQLNPLFKYPVSFYYRFFLDNNQETLLSPVSDIITPRQTYPLSYYNSFDVKIPLAQKIPIGVKRVEFIVYNIQTSAGGYTYGIYDTIDNTNGAFDDHNAGTQQLIGNYDFSEALTYMDPMAFTSIFQIAPFDIEALDIAGSRVFISNYKDFLENDADPIEAGDITITNVQPSGSNEFLVAERPVWTPGAKHDVYLMFLDEYGRPCAPQRVGQINIPYADRNNGGPDFGQNNWAYNYYNSSTVKPFHTEYVTIAYPGVDSTKRPSWATHAVLLLSEDLIQREHLTVIIPPSTYFNTGANYGHSFPGFKFAGFNTLKELITDSSAQEVRNNGADPSYWAIDFSTTTTQGSWIPEVGDRVRIRMYIDVSIGAASTSMSIPEDIVDLPVLAVSENMALVAPPEFSQLEYIGRYSVDANGQPGDGYSPLAIVVTAYKPRGEQSSVILRQVQSVRTSGMAALQTDIIGSEAFFKTTVSGHQYKNNIGTVTSEAFILFNVRPTSEIVQPIRYTNYGDRGFAYNSDTAIDDFTQKHKKLALIASGPLLTGTSINQLNVYDPLSEETLPETLGHVQSLKLAQKQQEIGTVMLAIGHSDTCSIYIGESALLDATGKESLFKSDKLIGSINTLLGQHGCQHKSTIVRNGRNVYWWNNAGGAYLRYDVNGLYPVSDYNAISLFNLLSKHSNDVTQAVGGFNPETKNVYLAIKSLAITPELAAGEVWESLGTTTATSTEFGTGTSLPVAVTWAAGKLSIGDVLRVELYANNSESVFPGALQTVGGISEILVGAEIVDEDIFSPIKQTSFLQSLSNSAQNIYAYHHYVNDTSITEVSVKIYTIESQSFTMRVYRGKLSAKAPVYGGRSVFKFDTANNAWTGYNTYCPDIMASLRQMPITFYKGLMYIHDNPEPTVYGNEMIASVAKYNKNKGAIGVIAPTSVSVSADKAPLKTVIETVKTGHNTFIPESEYRSYETHFYATVKRSVISPSTRLGGKVLRDNCVITQHIYEGQFKIERFALNFKSQKGHNF